uniref:Uncharacterized protein n=1 Tax=Cacopsylla melanoneura TaxID=428564 RepID=A0A8D9AWK1_9HEMI
MRTSFRRIVASVSRFFPVFVPFSCSVEIFCQTSIIVALCITTCVQSVHLVSSILYSLLSSPHIQCILMCVRLVPCELLSLSNMQCILKHNQLPILPKQLFVHPPNFSPQIIRVTFSVHFSLAFDFVQSRSNRFRVPNHTDRFRTAENIGQEFG